MFYLSNIFSGITARASSKDLLQQSESLLSEEGFKAILSVERKRSERSKKPFMVMVIDISDLLEQQGNRRSAKTRKIQIIQKTIEALHTETRSIDIKGWHLTGRSIGVLFTEFATDSHLLIRDKVREKLAKIFSAKNVTNIKITNHWYPSKEENTSSEYNQLFYPEYGSGSLMKSSAMTAKRVLDIFGACFGLLFFSPILIVSSVLIKVTSPGPIFFRQERVGKGGKTFKIFKFRTMEVNNCDNTHQEYMKNFIKGCAEGVSDETGKKVFKLVNDPRITPIGNFLRRTSLDEVPQFINVLLGNMSLVGPRPPIPYEVSEYDLWHRRRVLEIKPGITGFWQIEGRSTTNFDGMVRMDIKYITNWSLALDIKMILMTPFALFKAKGAY